LQTRALVSQCPICPPSAGQSVSTQQAELPMQSCPHFLVPVVQVKAQVWVAVVQVPFCPAPSIATQSLSVQQADVRTQVESAHALYPVPQVYPQACVLVLQVATSPVWALQSLSMQQAL
jgi:hypothetical protein